VAAFAYQKGFGGHFHNDCSVAVLRDIPGISVVVPARADDAIELFRTAAALAIAARRVVVVLEPIALYHTRDLHEDGDGAWLARPPSGFADFGRARVHRPHSRDLVIATYGNGVLMSLRAARALEREGIGARVLDLRWLVPLPHDDVTDHAAETGRLLVVDECRASGSPSEAILADVVDRGVTARIARVTSADSFVPLGDAAELVLVREAEIVDAARRLTRDDR
jgi:2-oxoisovalerate dehydrogenase E1 component